MEIKKEKEELVHEYRYSRRKLDNYMDLVHRSECPHCEQKIDYKFYESKIPKIELKLQGINKRFDEIIPIIIKMDKEEALANQKKYKEHKKRIDEYIKQNINKLNKCIKDYNKGIENYLPYIQDREKSTWNEAMEWYLDNRNMEENEELYFEIE